MQCGDFYHAVETKQLCTTKSFALPVPQFNFPLAPERGGERKERRRREGGRHICTQKHPNFLAERKAHPKLLIQKQLVFHQISYTGSKFCASCIRCNKAYAKKLCLQPSPLKVLQHNYSPSTLKAPEAIDT